MYKPYSSELKKSAVEKLLSPNSPGATKADKVLAVKIIDEAVNTFCRVKMACADLDILYNTFLNWKSNVCDINIDTIRKLTFTIRRKIR